jgi:hypothetical protein
MTFVLVCFYLQYRKQHTCSKSEGQALRTREATERISMLGHVQCKMLRELLREINRFLIQHWCLFILGRCLTRHLSYTNKHWCLRKSLVYFAKHPLSTLHYPWLTERISIQTTPAKLRPATIPPRRKAKSVLYKPQTPTGTETKVIG